MNKLSKFWWEFKDHFPGVHGVITGSLLALLLFAIIPVILKVMFAWWGFVLGVQV